MGDAILNARLDLLDQNLNIAIETTKILADDLEKLGLSSEMRNLLAGRFEGFGLKKRKRVDAIRKMLALPGNTQAAPSSNPWLEYVELCDETSQVYVEFLEAILGVAIRIKRLDQEICVIADELIRGMRGPYVQTSTLTIPASREAYSRTLASLVRLKFPEWTLWSLPLIAHEFGYVVIQEVEELSDFVDTLVKRQFPSRGKKKSPAQTLQAQSRARQLLADASAVYTIGPCYPCSLITLRLNPIPCQVECGRAPDAERAVFVLEILRQMDSPKSQRSYGTLITTLETHWAAMIEHSGALALTTEAVKELKDLAAIVKDKFDEGLAGTSYPLASSRLRTGWNIAQLWSEAWNETSIKNGRLVIPDSFTDTTKVHDALNAAWDYRLTYEPKNLMEIERVAIDLCKAIIAKRSPAASQQTLSDSGKVPATTAIGGAV